MITPFSTILTRHVKCIVGGRNLIVASHTADEGYEQWPLSATVIAFTGGNVPRR